MSVKILDNIDDTKDLGKARCECCNRPWEELKPFGQVGDKFYEGRLWSIHRSDDLPNEEFYRIMKEFFGKFPNEEEFWNGRDGLIQKYGTEKVRDLTDLFYAEHIHHGYSCIDCISLDDETYFEMSVQIY